MAARDRALGMLGMAARAGAILPGTERVREAVRGDGARLVIVAADASANSRDKLLPLLAARGVSHVIRYSRNELGAAVGRGPLSAVAVVERELADRLVMLLRDDVARE
jgi:ribosomal protein L7Ae-like RNA K-turn-binding protein